MKLNEITNFAVPRVLSIPTSPKEEVIFQLKDLRTLKLTFWVYRIFIPFQNGLTFPTCLCLV